MQRPITEEPPRASVSWLNKADDFARHEPTKAIVSAAGIGFVINLLPIGAIVGGLVVAAFALVRPALLFLGLLKAFEFFRAQSTHKN